MCLPSCSTGTGCPGMSRTSKPPPSQIAVLSGLPNHAQAMTVVARLLRTMPHGRTRLTGRLGAYFLLLFLFIAPAPGVLAADQPPAPQPAPVSADDLEQLVHTLQDDTARAKLIQELRTLLAVRRGAEEG